MSINRASNNIFIKPYEQYELKTYAQNNADNPIFSTQSQVDTFQRTTQNYQEDEIVNTESLRQDLEKTKKEQGIISKAWDGIKNFFGAKNSSSNVEKTIEKFENGEISEDEARQALDEYKNAQDTFTDKLSGIISTAGLIGTVAGAVLSFIPGGQVIGLPLLAISGKVALSGMFIDNALDLVDNSTDADGLTSDELKDLAIETGVEAVSYMAGRGIGKLTGNIHTNIANKLVSNGTNKVASQVIGYAGEAVTDGALSLAADYSIAQTQSLIATGKTVSWKDYWSWDRFTSEGRSQLIGILTGVATSKQYPGGAIAPATTGAGVASKGVKADVPVNKSPDTALQTNVPRRLMFNPETGELTPAKPQDEVKVEALDHPVAGDNVGVVLRENSFIDSADNTKTIDSTEETGAKTPVIKNRKIIDVGIDELKAQLPKISNSKFKSLKHALVNSEVGTIRVEDNIQIEKIDANTYRVTDLRALKENIPTEDMLVTIEGFKYSAFNGSEDALGSPGMQALVLKAEETLKLIRLYYDAGEISDNEVLVIYQTIKRMQNFQFDRTDTEIFNALNKYKSGLYQYINAILREEDVPKLASGIAYEKSQTQIIAYAEKQIPLLSSFLQSFELPIGTKLYRTDKYGIFSNLELKNGKYSGQKLSDLLESYANGGDVDLEDINNVLQGQTISQKSFLSTSILRSGAEDHNRQDRQIVWNFTTL